MKSTTDACANPFVAGGHQLTPVVTGVVTAATLAVAFGLMALGVESFWVAFVVGFGGVLPLSVAALEYREATDDTPTRADRSDADAALEELQLRYAHGEFTDEEFERQVEKLLETTAAEETGTRTHTRTDTGRSNGRS